MKYPIDPSLNLTLNDVRLEFYFQIFVREQVRVADMFPQLFRKIIFCQWSPYLGVTASAPPMHKTLLPLAACIV